MAKTLKPSKEITPKMREDYLTALGMARYGQQSGVKPLGISSPSKEKKEQRKDDPNG